MPSNINRRKFIKNTSLTRFSIPAIIEGTSSLAHKAKVDAQNLPELKDVDLIETTIDALQQKMQSGELTSKTITNWYLKRIKEIDKSGPSLNSIIELNADAISIAEALDAERKAGKVRGTLHGIPVLIKDNIDTGDAMMTTAGSIALEGNK